jgi:signal transduction histidine kinase
MGFYPGQADNGQVVKQWRLAGWASRVTALIRAASARPVLGGTSYLLDVCLAVAATIAALVAAINSYLPTVSVTAPAGRCPRLARLLPCPPLQPLPPIARTLAHPAAAHLSAVPSLAMLGVALTTAPLAFRRTYPTSAFCVIVLAVIATNQHSTAVTIASALFAAYFAVVYSKNRTAALCCLAAGVAVVTYDYPKIGAPVPERLTPLLVLLPTVALGYLMRMWQRRAGDSAARLRRAEAEHLELTRRAVEEERARIAAELHDVVTHNVSVMVVSAGASRRVMDSSPDDAREAMLAIEASGRTAMTELRHLLGLLAPAGAPEPDSAGAPAGPRAPVGQGALRPQPGLAEVQALCAGVRAAGLPVELSVTGTQCALPQGQDLAAYRVIQEALTNVIKHANRARAKVRIDYRAHDVVIDVANEGGVPADALPLSVADASGSGRGIIGLRERVAIYGGSLDVGPRPGGGWRVRATIPLERTEEPEPVSFQGTPA